MATILADHNIEGQALLIQDAFVKGGWSDLFPMKLVMFTDVGLAENSNDRVVWRFAQANRMFLLTGNRSDHEPDSLERTIREESTPDSLPVLTVGNVNRIKRERIYREKCADRIAEIFSDLENHLGTSRIFLP